MGDEKDLLMAIFSKSIRQLPAYLVSDRKSPVKRLVVVGIQILNEMFENKACQTVETGCAVLLPG